MEAVFLNYVACENLPKERRRKTNRVTACRREIYITNDIETCKKVLPGGKRNNAAATSPLSLPLLASSSNDSLTSPPQPIRAHKSILRWMAWLENEMEEDKRCILRALENSLMTFALAHPVNAKQLLHSASSPT
ncbi:hypothetical protein GOBAR_DD18973 [Gossypium barbadense]|nr:hypothetical protein GOBAR_DD18973 [Gossypium barbadense]